MKKLYILAVGLFLVIGQIAFAAEIKDSESATHESDSSTYKIVDTYSFPGFKVIQFTLRSVRVLLPPDERRGSSVGGPGP
jgi:hypothetical protein